MNEIEVIVQSVGNINVEVSTAGVRGPSGENILGGYPVQVSSSLTDGDLIQFKSGGIWSNSPQSNITDGGNF